MQRLKSVRGGPSSPQLAAQKSFASHSSLTDTDDEEEHQHVTQRSHSISNAAVGIAAFAPPICEDMLTYVSHVVFCQIVACSAIILVYESSVRGDDSAVVHVPPLLPVEDRGPSSQLVSCVWSI